MCHLSILSGVGIHLLIKGLVLAVYSNISKSLNLSLSGKANWVDSDSEYPCNPGKRTLSFMFIRSSSRKILFLSFFVNFNFNRIIGSLFVRYLFRFSSKLQVILPGTRNVPCCTINRSFNLNEFKRSTRFSFLFLKKYLRISLCNSSILKGFFFSMLIFYL